MFPNKFFCYRPVLFKEYPLEERGDRKEKTNVSSREGRGRNWSVEDIIFPLLSSLLRRYP